MGKKDKLIEKLLSNPKSFTYADTETLLGYFDYSVDNRGKTSGSRVLFRNEETSAKFAIHKPHPQKELKEYQAKQLIHHLEEENLI